MCHEALSNPKAKYCNDAHRMAFKRGKTRTREMNVVKVNPNIVKVNNQPEQEWDKEIFYDGEITPEILKKLQVIYKQYEKENKGFICQPYEVRGKQVLTAWERMKLKL